MTKIKGFLFGIRFRKVLRTAAFLKLLCSAFGILIPSFHKSDRKGRLLGLGN